eukprot:Seg2028.1 transcript_id=Seg2028.1/GoldUCD/mRNA.D3Y31 product="hypothetical protein" protein_id=Seg2028.1/GoldUCD/D3Y31
MDLSRMHRGSSKIMALLQIVVTKQDRMAKNLNTVEDSVSTLTARVDECDTNLTEIQDSLSKIEEFGCDNDMAQSRIIMELEQREKRRLNLIIYNLPEGQRDSTKDGRDADMKHLNKCINAQNEQKVAFENSTRLGKIHENGDPRPLRVTVETDADKELLLKKAKSFKDSENQVTKNLTVKPDQTPCQRSTWKKLASERDKQRSECLTQEEKDRWQIRNLKVVQLPLREQREMKRAKRAQQV